MEKKQVIRLTESDLHRILKESVNKVLNEEYVWWGDTKPLETIMSACGEMIKGKNESDFEDVDDRAAFDLYQWATKVYQEAEQFLHCNAHNTPINGGENW